MREGKINGGIVIFLVIILLLGTFLRLYQLDEESLWVDEGFTFHYSTAEVPKLITLLEYDVHPILFYIFERWMILGFGTSEFWLRFLPFIFGSLCIIVLFFLVKKLYGDRVALLSSAFFSFSYIFILYSQEAKMYSQFIFFFFLVCIFYLRFILSGRLNDALWLALFNCFLVHTHILSFGILYLEFVVFFVFYRFKRSQNIDIINHISKKLTGVYRPTYFMLNFGFIFLTYMFWLPVFYYQFDRLFLDMLPLKFNQKFGFDGFFVLFSIFLLAVFSLSLLLYYIAGNKKITNKIKNNTKSLKSPPALFVIIFISFLLINLFFHRPFFGNVPYVRYLMVFIPLLYIFFAKKLFSLPSRKLFTLLITLYLVTASVILIDYYSIDGKEQFREAAGYVIENGGDILLFDTSIHAWYAFDYYYHGNIEQIRLQKDPSVIPYVTKGKKQVILVLSHNYYTKDLFKDKLAENYALIEEKKFIGVTVVKFRR